MLSQQQRRIRFLLIFSWVCNTVPEMLWNCKTLAREMGCFCCYLAFSCGLSVLLIPDRLRAYKNRSSWVGKGRLGSWPEGCDLRKKFVSSGCLCVLCGGLGLACSSSLYNLKSDSFEKCMQFTLGIRILLDKIISCHPQILFWLPLQSKPKQYLLAASVSRGWQRCVLVQK